MKKTVNKLTVIFLSLLLIGAGIASTLVMSKARADTAIAKTSLIDLGTNADGKDINKSNYYATINGEEGFCVSPGPTYNCEPYPNHVGLAQFWPNEYMKDGELYDGSGETMETAGTNYADYTPVWKFLAYYGYIAPKTAQARQAAGWSSDRINATVFSTSTDNNRFVDSTGKNCIWFPANQSYAICVCANYDQPDENRIWHIYGVNKKDIGWALTQFTLWEYSAEHASDYSGGAIGNYSIKNWFTTTTTNLTDELATAVNRELDPDDLVDDLTTADIWKDVEAFLAVARNNRADEKSSSYETHIWQTTESGRKGWGTGKCQDIFTMSTEVEEPKDYKVHYMYKAADGDEYIEKATSSSITEGDTYTVAHSPSEYKTADTTTKKYTSKVGWTYKTSSSGAYSTDDYTIGGSFIMPSSDVYLYSTEDSTPVTPGSYYVHYMYKTADGDEYIEKATSPSITEGDTYTVAHAPSEYVTASTSTVTYTAKAGWTYETSSGKQWTKNDYYKDGSPNTFTMPARDVYLYSTEDSAPVDSYKVHYMYKTADGDKYFETDTSSSMTEGTTYTVAYAPSKYVTASTSTVTYTAKAGWTYETSSGKQWTKNDYYKDKSPNTFTMPANDVYLYSTEDSTPVVTPDSYYVHYMYKSVGGSGYFEKEKSSSITEGATYTVAHAPSEYVTKSTSTVTYTAKAGWTYSVKSDGSWTGNTNVKSSTFTMPASDVYLYSTEQEYLKSTKSADVTVRHAGETVNWTVSQVVSDNPQIRYTSFKMVDTLPAEVTYTDGSAKVYQVYNGKETDITTTAGTLAYSATARTLTYTFNSTFLTGSTYKQAGETYKLVFATTVNNDVAGDTTIINREKTYIDDYSSEATANVIPLLPPAKTITDDATGEEVTSVPGIIGATKHFTVLQQVNDLATTDKTRYKSFVITDAFPEQLEYVDGSAKVYKVDRDGTKTDITTAAGSFTEETAQKVTYTFSAAYLASMDMKGETYQLENDARIVAYAEVIENQGIVTINDDPATVVADITPDDPDVPVKTADPVEWTQVSRGQSITYTVSYTNDSHDIIELTLRDPIPVNTTYVKDTLTAEGATEAVYDEENTQVKASWTEVKPGDTKTMTFTVTVNDDAPYASILHNIGYAKVFDNPEVETNEVKHPVEPPTIPGDYVTVYKTSDPVTGTLVEAGQEITYTLNAKNTGATTSAYTLVRDEIPEGTTYVDGSVTDGGAYVSADDSTTGKAYVEWVVSNIAPNAEKKVGSFKVTVDEETAAAGDRVVNYATYGASTTPLTPGDKSNPTPEDKTNSTIHPTDPDDKVPAVVQVIKDSDPVPGSVVEWGQTITYKLTVKNVGGSNSSAAEDVYVMDYIPALTTYVNGSVSADNAGAYNASSNFVSWKIPSLAVNEEVTLTFQVTVNSNIEVGKNIDNQALYEANWDDNNTDLPKNASNKVQHNTAKAADIPIQMAATSDSSPIGIIIICGLCVAIAGIRHIRKRRL